MNFILRTQSLSPLLIPDEFLLAELAELRNEQLELFQQHEDKYFDKLEQRKKNKM
jgi:hypothetical protein